MNREEIVKYAREHDGNVPMFGWPGGYPLEYWDRDMSLLCPECAQELIQAWIVQGCKDACDLDDDTMDALVHPVFDYEVPIGCAVYWEGSDQYCTECNATIESAHGDPWADDDVS